MINILLSGGGDRSDARLAMLIASIIPKKGRLLYIPVAMPPSSHSFGECYDWVARLFKRHMQGGIDMWTDLRDRKYEDLAKYSIAFIGGGNTFYLLNLFRKTGFDRLLTRYIKNSMPVYGGSAGAILLGKDIGTASFGGDKDENKVNIKDLRGLNFANGYSIDCHHNKKEYDRNAAAYSVKTGIPTIALPDSTALQVKGKRIRVLGPGPAKVFRGRDYKVFKPGSTIGQP